MHAGDVVVGLQIGGLTTFFGGWKAVVAAVTKAASAMAGELKSIVMEQAAVGDELQKLSQKIDFSVEGLSRMKTALELSGAGLSDLQTAMRGVSNVVDGAKDGLSTATRTLQKMGVSLKDLEGLSGEQTFNKMAQAIAAIDDKGVQAAVAIEAFGRSAQNMLPYIQSMGGETNKLADMMGNVWTKEQADEAAYFGDILTLIKTAMQGLYKTIAVQLFPILARVFAAIAAFMPVMAEWVERTNFVGQAVGWLTKKWEEFWMAIREFGIATTLIWGEVTKAAQKMSNEVSIYFLEMKVNALSAVADFFATLNSMTGTGGGRTVLNAMGLEPSMISGAIQEVSTSLRDAMQQLNDETRANMEMQGNPLQSVVNSIREGTMSSITQIGDLVLSSTDQLGQYADNADATFRKMMAGFNKSQQSMKTEQTKTINTMSKMQAGFRDFAIQTYIDLMNGAGGSLKEILGKFLSGLGAQAMQEGMFHILAGQAKMADPITAPAGVRQRHGGQKLLAWGAVAVALGGAIGKSGGDAGAAGDAGGGGDSGGGGDLGDRTGPGYEVDDEKEKPRQQVQVVVQGSMFDSRETWVRMSEIAREHSDADITITQAALGRV